MRQDGTPIQRSGQRMTLKQLRAIIAKATAQ